jgi:NADPH-dependent 2,4-dienoyl-CoA reductase/sulfur reductase-like enzyme
VAVSDLDGVFTLRTLADATNVRERARASKRAVVVGSNFIGLETAASLTQIGLHVTLCDRGRELFRALQCPPLSAHLDSVYRAHGVELLYEDEIAEIRGDGHVESVVTRGSAEREADLVVAGIGVTANTGFLAGTAVEIDDGVVVDEGFESSVPGIYAVGDAARFHDPLFGRSRRIEHWSNAAYQGAELGKILARAPGGYATVSSFFSEVFGQGIRFFGDATGHDELVPRRLRRGRPSLLRRRGRMVQRWPWAPATGTAHPRLIRDGGPPRRSPGSRSAGLCELARPRDGGGVVCFGHHLGRLACPACRARPAITQRPPRSASAGARRPARPPPSDPRP